MKKMMVLAMAALLCGLMVPGLAGAVDLMADGGGGAGYKVGDVTFAFSDAGLTVTVTPLTPWCLTDVHIDVRTAPDFPMLKNKNPKLKAFAYKESFDFAASACTSSVSQTFASFNATQTLYVAVHAAIVDKTQETDGIPGITAEDYVYESAWIQGTPFGGKNWAMYYELLPVTF